MSHDRVSYYRVARLALHVPATQGALAPWSLIATGVKRGIPSSSIIVDGRVPCPAHNPTTEELLEAFDAALRQCMLPR
jgi:hypothetical protein